MTPTEAVIAGTKVVVLAGRLDSSTEEASRLHLLAAAQDGRRALILDLSAIDYVSSAGLRVLVLAVKRTQSLRIPIALCGANAALQELLDISDLASLFPLYDTAAAAVAATAG